MINNITIGQYYPADSLIHKLDSRVKLLATIVYITMLFMPLDFFGYVFAALCLVYVIIASRVPFKYMLKGLRMVLFIIIFTTSINIFFTSGETLLSFWVINITKEGLIATARLSVRIVLLIIGASILTLTTSPIQLTDAIEYALSPLKRIGVPAHEIAMMMTIALRFIPTLIEEMDKIMKAQTARGADFDTGGVVKKAKSLIPLLVPLFISAFRRADDLAVAMEARCYRGGEGRTKLRVMKFNARDYTALACIGAFVLVLILSVVIKV